MQKNLASRREAGTCEAGRHGSIALIVEGIAGVNGDFQLGLRSSGAVQTPHVHLRREILTSHLRAEQPGELHETGDLDCRAG